MLWNCSLARRGRHWRRIVLKRLVLASALPRAKSTHDSKPARASKGSNTGGGLASSCWREKRVDADILFNSRSWFWSSLTVISAWRKGQNKIEIRIPSSTRRKIFTTIRHTETTTVLDKVDKTSSLRASITCTLHTDQANASNRLHAAILSVRLHRILKLKTHEVRKMETSINRTCRDYKTPCDMNPTKKVQCDKQSNLTSSCLRPCILNNPEVL